MRNFAEHLYEILGQPDNCEFEDLPENGKLKRFCVINS